MSEVLRSGSTTIIQKPHWNGAGFDGELAQSYWLELPGVLQRVALAEIGAGNVPSHILRNNDRGIVLLEFERGPLGDPPPVGVVVHSEHRYGNYCYDGTKCTYEDSAVGSFLAFKDPS
jgi:hypothetical protein